MRPAMMRSSVDLPEPDFPSRATISPSPSEKFTPSGIVRGVPSALRKDFETPRRSSRDSLMAWILVAAAFGQEVQAPPEEAIEQHDEQAHHPDAERDAVEVAGVGHA